MAEPQQGTSSVNSKENKALLDEDIEKDFLSSWKSMSVKEDDSMDFSFDSIPKTKNKKFNFENMDMDFNLDVDFKVDMPEINFSFSPTKTSNPKDKMEESSCENQGKKEKFAFSFDFNELDSFNFDSSLVEEEKDPEKRIAKKGVASSDTEGQGFKSNKATENGEIEGDVTVNPQPSQSMVTTKADSISDHQTNLDVVRKSCPSNSGTSDSNPVLSHGATKKYQRKAAISAELLNPGRHMLETSISKEMVAKQPMVMSEQSVEMDVFNMGTTAKVESEHCYQETRAVTSGSGNECTNNKVITCLESNSVKSLMKGSAALAAVLLERNKSGNGETSSHSLSKSISGNGSSRNDLELCDTSTSNSTKMQHDVTTNKENQNATEIISKAPLCSQVMVDKVTLMKGNKGSAIHSRFFKRPIEDKTRTQPESAAGLRAISAASGTTATINSTLLDEKRGVLHANNTQSQSKAVSSRDVKKYEPVKLAKRNIGSLKDNRNDFVVNVAQDGSKHSHNNGQNNREVTETEAAANKSVNDNKDFSSSGFLSSTPSSTEKAKTSTTQLHLGSNILDSHLAPIQRSKIISSVKGHSCPPRPAKKLTDLSNMVISRNMEPNKDPTKYTPGDENFSQRNMVASSVGSTAKHTTFSPTLKRKLSEEPSADFMLLNPSKRLSESPTQNRNIKDIVDRVSTGQAKEKNFFQGTSRSEFSPELQMTDFGSPSAMDNDSNVEKAETYTKELEDICNMLRKKHEEAKELMVRAVVNNNNLLMLNHPMHEEKIRTVQKFAAELMSKELPV